MVHNAIFLKCWWHVLHPPCVAFSFTLSTFLFIECCLSWKKHHLICSSTTIIFFCTVFRLGQRMFWGFITSCYLMSTTIVRRSLSFLWRSFCSSSSMNVVAQTFKRQGGLVINHNINNKPLQMTLTGWRCHVQCCCYRATNASTRVVVMPLRLFEKLKYVQNYDTRGITIMSAHKASI